MEIFIICGTLFGYLLAMFILYYTNKIDSELLNEIIKLEEQFKTLKTEHQRLKEMLFHLTK